jgi:hypothetical protein
VSLAAASRAYKCVPTQAEESCPNLNESSDVTKVSKCGLYLMGWLLSHLPRRHGCIWKWLSTLEVLSLPGVAQSLEDLLICSGLLLYQTKPQKGSDGKIKCKSSGSLDSQNWILVT